MGRSGFDDFPLYGTDYIGRNGGALTSTPSLEQLSTASAVVVSGSELDARLARMVAYTLACATEDVTVTLEAANESDFSDAFTLQSYALTAGTPAGASLVDPAFSFYRLKIVDTSGGSQGTFTGKGVAKN